MNKIQTLFDGNKRCVEWKLKQKDMNARRIETITCQKPFAIVVSCSDSRVVPEYIFDANIEYYVGHLHAISLVILWHEKCGAITVAYKLLHENSNIDLVIDKIKPAVYKAGKDNIELTIEENVKCVKKYICTSSRVVDEKIKKCELKIIGMKYSLTTGKGELIN